jgi:hypothetical protein
MRKIKRSIMNRIRMILPVLLVILFIVHTSIGQSADNTNDSTILENPATPENTTSTANETILQGPAALSANVTVKTVPNLSYIWSVTGLEPGQVIMVLHQEGEELFGQAKYESDSGPFWNAIVIGSVAGEDVDLVMTALKEDEQTSSRLTGTFDDDSQSLKGNFFQVSEDRISGRGDFEAMWINPDTSSYAQAAVRKTKPEVAAPSEADDLAVSQAEAQMPQQPEKTSRFHDVHQDADRILTGVGDISQIPIGMGGSGLA